MPNRAAAYARSSTQPPHSPRPESDLRATDAEQLAAHAAGVDRGRLSVLGDVDDEFCDRYADLVAARARRIPLQHIDRCRPVRPVTFQVGPGVFIPRPETEALLEWASAQPLPPRPVIVDLCTGSGALAVALSRYWPDARVIAVDDSDDALRLRLPQRRGHGRRTGAGRHHRTRPAAGPRRPGRPAGRQPALYS